MKYIINNIKWYYPSFGGGVAFCDLSVILLNNSDYLVIFTELKDNTGTSVTNSIETLIYMIKKNLLRHVDWDEITWVEHYEGQITYDLVTITVVTDLEGHKEEFIQNIGWKHFNCLDEIIEGVKGNEPSSDRN